MLKNGIEMTLKRIQAKLAFFSIFLCTFVLANIHLFFI